MKKVSFLFKVLMTLLAFALPLSCDTGGGGSGGGGSSAKNSDSGTTSVTITIPKAASSSSDINLLGDFTPQYATANFHYGIYFKNDARTSETQYATAGGSVTFDNVEYDTYDFCLDIYVDSHKKTKLNTITVNKTISASENTVQFPNMSVSSYKQWFFVATKEDFLDAITKIKSDTETYTAEKKAIICLRDSIACPGFQSKLNEIEGRYTLYTNNYELEEVLYTVGIAGGITGGAVSADPTSASVGREITLTITPDEEKELDTLSVSGVTEINYNDARTEATFAMPASNVTVSATFKTKKYTVTIAGSGAGGTVELYGTTASEFEKGQSIVLAITKNSGYRLDSLKVDDDEKVSEIADNTLSFTMPNKNIVITAEFVQLYSITLPADITEATFVAKIGEDEVTEAAENDSVTITITPASGYALETLKQGDGDVTESVSNNEYEFIMDAESVEFTATWKAEEKTPDTAGDVILSTGKAVAYANIAKMSSSQKSAVVGIFTANGRMTELGESSAVKWYNTSGHPASDYVGLADSNDGIVNRTTLTNAGKNISNYPPFSYAASKNSSGSTIDWYVPATNELSKITSNQDKINNTVTALNDISISATNVDKSAGYWSSKEIANDVSHYASCYKESGFETVSAYTDTSYRVRCVARVPSE